MNLEGTVKRGKPAVRLSSAFRKIFFRMGGL